MANGMRFRLEAVEFGDGGVLATFEFGDPEEDMLFRVNWLVDYDPAGSLENALAGASAEVGAFLRECADSADRQAAALRRP